MLKPSMRVIPRAAPRRAGAWRISSCLDGSYASNRLSRTAPSLRRVSLRCVPPRRSPRRAVSRRAAPLLSLPRRFYTSRSLAWRFCTLKARAACRNAAAMEPVCNNAAAMEPACRNAAPRPLRVEIRVAPHPTESVATLRHRYRHSIRLSVQFVATDCMANRRRSVSSRLGHLYVSKGSQGPGRPGRGRPGRGRPSRRPPPGDARMLRRA